MKIKLPRLLVIAMDLFLKTNKRFELDKILFSLNSSDVIEEYKIPQKYGLALKKKQDFISVPNILYRVEDHIKDVVYEQLPSSLLAIENPTVKLLTVTPTSSNKSTMLAPHVDIGRKCCLNIYINTHAERTIYYEYKAGKVEEVSSFIASDGECWLIDVSKPHAVMLSPPHVRKAVTVSFVSTPYEEVVKHFCDE